MPELKTAPSHEVERILQLEEGHYLDVKRVEIKPSKLSETISAFANTSGGEVFVGIAETKRDSGKHREWAGFADMETANAHIQVLEGMGTLGNHYSAEFLSSSGQRGYILHLIIPKTKDILKATDGFPYTRKNAQNLRVDSNEGLQRLRLDKGVVTFEDETLSIPHRTITNSKVALEFLIDVVPSAEPEEWLESQFVLVGDKPTVAGLLLFSDQPQAALPKRSAVKIYRYKSREEEGSRETLAFDPVTIEGCVYDLISETVERTKKLV
jgi:ATP-dependent DNA helicase RecG